MKIDLFDRLNGNKLGFGSLHLRDCAAREIDAMVDAFLGAGFLYFEAAHGYGNEHLFRKHLTKRHNRTDFLLADKMPIRGKKEYTCKRFMDTFHTSLETCGVDYFDFYLLHNLGAKEYNAFKESDYFELLADIKEKGLATKIGFSFHDTVDVLDEILAKHHEILDFVQLQINYADWDSQIIQSRDCYETAVKYNIPVFAMVPAKGGLLLDLPDSVMDVFKKANPEYSPVAWAYGFAASLDNVAIVLSGMKNAKQVRENSDIMRKMQNTGFSDVEKRVVASARELLKQINRIQCTGCAYCVSMCVQEIPIPKLLDFLTMNSVGESIMFNRLYGREKISSKIGCIKCKKCEMVCPQKLPIAELISKVCVKYDNPPTPMVKRVVSKVLRKLGLFSYVKRFYYRVIAKK